MLVTAKVKCVKDDEGTRKIFCNGNLFFLEEFMQDNCFYEIIIKEVEGDVYVK